MILGLTEAESDDLRTEAVALLSKVFLLLFLSIHQGVDDQRLKPIKII